MKHLFFLQVNADVLKLVQFRSEGFSYIGQWILFGFFGVFVVGISVMVYFLIRRSREQEQFTRLREETRIRLLLSEFNLTDADRELFEIFTESKSPGRYIPLLESRTVFEEAIRNFRQRAPGHPAAMQVAKLRNRLGYGFGNVRNTFADTRMLPVGTKLQCKIPQVKRDVIFLTSVVGTNEEFFLIRPPHAKGKPLQLRQIPNLTLKASRDDDAEYEFVGTVIGQNKDAMKTIAVSHTEDIQKLMFRNAPRLSVDLSTRFYVVKQEVAEARGHGHFKASESQFAFEGQLRDLSVGGSLLVTPVSPKNPQIGDLAVFRLPSAQIHEELVAEVVRHTPLPGDFLQIHLRFSGMKEINRLKINRFLQTLAETAVPPPGGEEKASQAAR